MKKLILVVLTFMESGIAVAQNNPVQLFDLYEPPAVKFRFETPGWYILTGILFFIAMKVIIRQIRKYIRNRYRREALQKLETLAINGHDIPQLLMVLKQTALQAFSREEVGHLYGKEWLTFLEKTGKDVRIAVYEEPISQAVYAGKKIDRDTRNNILTNARKWVKTHAA